MNSTTARRLHRIRKGWDCPHCNMHFGWSKQFADHLSICRPEPKPASVKIGLRYSR